MLIPKKSLIATLAVSVCLSTTGVLSAQALEPASNPVISATSADGELTQSDVDLLRHIAAIDVEHASDAELRFLGFTADRDSSGNVVAYRMDAETRAQMEREQLLIQSEDELTSMHSKMHGHVAHPMGGAMNWVRCTAQLGAFVVSYVIPAGRAGAIAVKAIGIVKRRGVAKTIQILKKFRKLKGVEAKDAADLIAAVVGLDFLAPCKAAMGF